MGTIGTIVAELAGSSMRPVRALLLDKRPDTNWSLGWHQDRTIVVRRKVVVDGYGPWTIKQGLLHVSPPATLLARMPTVRIHLDAVDDDNAPLLVAPGTHRYGRIAEAEVDGLVAVHGVRTCLAGQGDVWCYATPILHASNPARRPRSRRVLQVDYSAEQLPGGLTWLGL